VLAFTVEAGEAGEGPLVLRESRRFAHSAAYLSDVLRAAGFTELRLSEAVLRKDRGAEIRGFVVVAGGLQRARDRQGDGEGLALA